MGSGIYHSTLTFRTHLLNINLGDWESCRLQINKKEMVNQEEEVAPHKFSPPHHHGFIPLSYAKSHRLMSRSP